eukprot:351017-Chlamydomonas_euryale.AAC.7
MPRQSWSLPGFPIPRPSLHRLDRTLDVMPSSGIVLCCHATTGPLMCEQQPSNNKSPVVCHQFAPLSLPFATGTRKPHRLSFQQQLCRHDWVLSQLRRRQPPFAVAAATR